MTDSEAYLKNDTHLRWRLYQLAEDNKYKSITPRKLFYLAVAAGLVKNIPVGWDATRFYLC